MSMKDSDYLEIARIFGDQSTCRRLFVGAILVKDRRIISSGYNGAPSGLAHCNHSDITPCQRAVHAEANCIAFAAKNGVATDGSVLYSTHAPCISCAQLLINSGIKKVVYGEEYRKTEGQELLEEAGIPVIQIDQPRVRPMPSTSRDTTGVFACNDCGEKFYLAGPGHRCRGSAGRTGREDGGVVLGPSRTVAEILAEGDRSGPG